MRLRQSSGVALLQRCSDMAGRGELADLRAAPPTLAIDVTPATEWEPPALLSRSGKVRTQQRTVRVLLGLLAAGLTACGAPTPPTALSAVTRADLAGTPPATFIAVDDQNGNQSVALYSSTTGKVISRLLSGSLDGMSVVNLALDGRGFLWVTYDHGPAYANSTLGGDPQSNSCANDVIRVDLATGRSTTVLSTGSDELVTGAWPSPDGRMYVYADSGCANSYFDTHFTVVDIASGSTWTIGAGLQRCHLLSNPAWTPDSRSLVVAYGASTGDSNMPLGACSQWTPARLVVVNALNAQDGLSGLSAAPDPSCEFHAATAMAAGPIGLEHCNASSNDTSGGYVDGPARLVVFNTQLRAESRIALGECEDGAEVAADHAGSAALVSAYLYCPGATSPTTTLWRYSSSGLTPLTQVPGDGAPHDDITW
jgi:hypothetical protein